ncbi:MAG: type II toxin-antitoxin system VapC family toxin [Burkholderiales bacterium]
MSRFILDCSVAVSWCFEDETSSRADTVLGMLLHNEAIVPAIWPLEIANSLLVGERRKRLAKAQTVLFLEKLAALPIKLDKSDPDLAEVLTLGRAQDLSAYDSAYLELALRNRLPLATLDARLAKAAKRCGVKLLIE